jgi:hypothetical protein
MAKKPSKTAKSDSSKAKTGRATKGKAAKAAARGGAAAAKSQPAPAKGGKAVIEGVAPLEQGCSAIAALRSALLALGCDLSYDILSVAGGEAFRLFVQLDRMRHTASKDARPLAGVRIASTWFATYNILEETCATLGIRARVVRLEKKPASTRAEAVWRDIERRIREGCPVPTCGAPGSFEHEWCVITGVDPAGDRVLFRDTTHRGELYAQGPRHSVWQGWLPGPEDMPWMPHVLIEAAPKKLPSAEKLADLAVRRAVMAANMSFVAPSWAAGLAAYHAWILQLGQDQWHLESINHLREPALANSWLLSNTFAGRRAAGQFFAEAARFYAGKKNAAVHRASKLYTASAGALHSAMALFPNWGQGYEEAERRHRAMELLTIAEAAEREAVEHLEEAFDL